MGNNREGTSRWADLLTEQRNPASANIDELPTSEVLRVMNAEDRKVPEAVGMVLAGVARAVDLVVGAFQKGGRLFYVGAGTSGRLGVLDAAECPPTFDTHPHMVQGIIAGGEAALTRSQEGAEDQQDSGAAALRAQGLKQHDVVMGVAASGVTPFVLGALSQARKTGAAALFLTCNPSSAESVEADVKIVPEVGPEVITGSTRLKAGTATKLVLNMVTTAAMVRMGKTYGNLMVDLTPSCAKLQDRAERILSEVTGLSREQSCQALQASGNNLKTAITMVKRAVSKETARRLLARHNGIVKKALEAEI